MKGKALYLMTTAALLLASCLPDSDDASRSRAVEFTASVSDRGEVRTRTLVTEYIASDPFDMDFYIQLCTTKDGNIEYTEFETYVVQSAYEGRLAAADGTGLSWHTLNRDHTFYAWNIPWDRAYTVEKAKQDESIRIEFKNSSEEDGFDKHHNNAVYEHFIGAKSEPYSYKQHGKYVDLTFHHLVSRIRIGSFILIQPSGAIQKNLKADVTFVGMPTEATFYPHPQDGGRPRVEPVPPEDYNLDKGVTYFIDNSATADDTETKDIFYICPEVDFSRVDFQVKIKNDEYGDYDTYYGTFDNVEFKRTPGEDYDAEDGNDEKILHAGEMMTLNIVLIPGVGPGLAVIIDPWSTDNPRDSQYHTHPGIYSDAEVKELHDHFANQARGTYGDPDEAVDRFFDMYGQKKTIDGKEEKVFVLYDDVDISKGSDANIFPIPPGYIVDGMGHTITLKTNGNNTNYVKGPYFNIGPVRDVWLTDGTNTIYIDADGYVWIYDQEQQAFVQTKNHLDPLEPGDSEKTTQKSYDISCVDGTVHNSTYYNGKVEGDG